MRRARGKKGGSAAVQGEHQLLWLTAGVISTLLAAIVLCVSSRAHAADGGSPITRAVVLAPEDLDRITAGGLTLQINADAAARGATAFTQASTSFDVTYVQALKVHVDPTPDPHPPYMMGNQELAVTRGNGSANASGDQGADCAVSATFASPDLIASTMSAEKVMTAVTALCQCSFLAVSIVR